VDGHASRSPVGFLPFISFHFMAMLQFCSSVVVLAAVAGSVTAAIGPVATLPIVSAQIAPDGFARS
jgi:hypothetical protein